MHAWIVVGASWKKGRVESVSAQRKEIFIDYEVTLTTAVWYKSKEEIQELRNKKNGSPNKAYCEQNVRYRS